MPGWIHVPEEGRRTTLFPPESIQACQMPLPTWVPARIVRLLCGEGHGNITPDVFTQYLARPPWFCTNEDSSRLTVFPDQGAVCIIPALGKIGMRFMQCPIPYPRPEFPCGRLSN